MFSSSYWEKEGKKDLKPRKKINLDMKREVKGRREKKRGRLKGRRICDGKMKESEMKGENESQKSILVVIAAK